MLVSYNIDEGMVSIIKVNNGIKEPTPRVPEL